MFFCILSYYFHSISNRYNISWKCLTSDKTTVIYQVTFRAYSRHPSENNQGNFHSIFQWFFTAWLDYFMHKQGWITCNVSKKTMKVYERLALQCIHLIPQCRINGTSKQYAKMLSIIQIEFHDTYNENQRSCYVLDFHSAALLGHVCNFTNLPEKDTRHPRSCTSVRHTIIKEEVGPSRRGRHHEVLEVSPEPVIITARR